MKSLNPLSRTLYFPLPGLPMPQQTPELLDGYGMRLTVTIHHHASHPAPGPRLWSATLKDPSKQDGVGQRRTHCKKRRPPYAVFGIACRMPALQCFLAAVHESLAGLHARTVLSVTRCGDRKRNLLCGAELISSTTRAALFQSWRSKPSSCNRSVESLLYRAYCCLKGAFMCRTILVQLIDAIRARLRAAL